MTQQALRRRARLAALTAVLALAGCAGSSNDDGTGADKHFSFSYTASASDNVYEALANAYMDKHPEVTIKLNSVPNDTYDTTLRTQLQAGNAADLIQTAPGSGQGRSVIELARAGFLAPLDDTSTKIIPAGSESLFQLDGVTYGHGLDITVNGVVTNLTAAKSVGLDPIPTDFAEYLAACADVATKGRSMLAVAGAAVSNVGQMAMAISATRVYADEPDWNQKRSTGKTTFAKSDGWRNTLQTITALKEAGCFQPGVEGSDVDVIFNGLVGGTRIGAFAPSGAAAEFSRGAGKDVNFGILPFPSTAGSKPFVLAGSTYSLAITEASKNKEAAQAFLDWVATPEASALYVKVSGALPLAGYASADLGDTFYAPVADLLADRRYAPTPNTVWPKARVFETLSTGAQGLLTGQKTIDQVLEELDVAWDQ